MDSLANYVISVGGKSRKAGMIRINHKKAALINLDGKTFEVAFPNDFDFDKPILISVNGKNHQINLRKNDRYMTFNVEVDGKQFALQLEAKGRELNNKTSTTIITTPHLPKREKTVAKKSGAVTSLMPGKVVLLKVKTGDKVKAGDPLCVLEAMKMENEILAPKDGTVTQVRVEQGSIVNKGDVLMVIE